MNNRLDGRVALVTGSDRGIGKATAIELASRGANVIIHCRPKADSEHRAEELKSFIEKNYGKTAGILVADLGSRDQINELSDTLREAIDDEGIESINGLDILVNNAAMSRWVEIEDLTLEDLDYTYQINVAAPLQLVKMAYPLMKNGGRIVNISSLGTQMILPASICYTTVKAALEGMTRALAPELTRYGILVNVVCPGFVDTRSLKMLLRKKEMRDLLEWIKTTYRQDIVMPPEEVAEKIADLCSFDLNVTGETIPVDRGLASFFEQHRREYDEALA